MFYEGKLQCYLCHTALNTLHKTSILLLKAFIRPLAVTFPVALFVLDMQFLWVYADDFIGKGIEPWVIAQLMFYASARIVNLALPLAILVASIMAIGNLSESNELTAMKSAGMSLLNILKPLIVFMLIVSAGSLWFSSSAWPSANVNFRALLYSVTRQRPALNIRPGVFYTGIEGFSIRIESKDTDGILTDILIHDHRNPENGFSRIIRAESGRMHHDSQRDDLVIELTNGTSYEDQTEKNLRRKEKLHPHVISSFSASTMRIDLSSLDFDLADEGLFRRSYEMMSLPKLREAIDSLDNMSEIERQQIVNYGVKAIRLLQDSIKLPEISPNLSSTTWFQNLTRVEKNSLFAKAKELSRNQVRGIENALDKVEGRELRRDRHAIEWHRKFILSVSCLVLFFVGASLGALTKKGGMGMPVVLAISVFLAYYIISMVGEQMVKSGSLAPSIGMWLSTIVLVPLAIALTTFAIREGRIFK